MNKLPENTWLSREFCNRWSGRLVVDGKYVKVKGYDKKILFIYGIDYLSHDIPVSVLAPSENEWAFNKFFNLIHTIHSAERWLNAWMIRRRTKPFTDCEEPFKHLNRKSSLEVTLKKMGSFQRY